ncbi:BAH_G0000040.mRNA.1.CDS.1 [Saccharomyces cerevisiae]|nr:BAH_G0000040.mRNA.1.CDS.1 [Saccharomyces cerevisiae]CAI7032978.1 BAH_G0000040.mRNA.1.CDS.1 [Saccharomyces cerevisiae]
MAAIRDYKTALDFTKSLPRPDGYQANQEYYFKHSISFLSNGHRDRVRNGHFLALLRVSVSFTITVPQRTKLTWSEESRTMKIGFINNRYDFSNYDRWCS